MRKQHACSIKVYLRKSFIILFLSTMSTQFVPCFYSISLPMDILTLEGHFRFEGIDHAARDFGNQYQFHPLAVLYPESVSDIAKTIKYIWRMGPSSDLTVAARGCGHSLQGQAQTHGGIVIDMGSLRAKPMQVVHDGEFAPYVDVSGGEMWINILQETLKYGLAPKAWTDYLHLSVGGTLSNAGVSGQAFRHGPQISNVHQLEVVTGMLNSKTHDLFILPFFYFSLFC